MAARPASHAPTQPSRRRRGLLATAAVLIALALSLTLASTADAGDIFAPYQGTWHATSQGVNVTFTDNVATLAWVPVKGGCNPMSAKIRFSPPDSRHIMKGVVRSISGCVAKGHLLQVGQRVVVALNPATHHLWLTPASLQRLWLCRSTKDKYCYLRG